MYRHRGMRLSMSPYPSLLPARAMRQGTDDALGHGGCSVLLCLSSFLQRVSFQSFLLQGDSSLDVLLANRCHLAVRIVDKGIHRHATRSVRWRPSE